MTFFFCVGKNEPWRYVVLDNAAYGDFIDVMKAVSFYLALCIMKFNPLASQVFKIASKKQLDNDSVFAEYYDQEFPETLDCLNRINYLGAKNWQTLHRILRIRPIVSLLFHWHLAP